MARGSGGPRAGRPGSASTPAGPARPAYLAGALLAFSGLLDIAASPAGIAADPYYVLTNGRFYHLDFTGWAWLRLTVGVVTALAGLAVMANRRWSAGAGITGAGLSVVAALLAVAYNPLRALLEIPLNLAAARLILRHRRTRGTAAHAHRSNAR